MIYLEESIVRHRKFVLAGAMLSRCGGVLAALGLYAAGVGYAREHFTNGRIDDEYLSTFPPGTGAVSVAKVLSSRRVRLWHRVRGGYLIHDFLDHNVPAESAKRKREQARQRKAAERARKAAAANGRGEKLPAVTHSVTRDIERDLARARAPLPLSLVRTEKNPRTARPAPPSRVTPTEGEVLAWRRRRSKGTDGVGQPKVATLSALARHVLAAHPDEHDDGELEERIKVAAARANLKYDSRSVGVALGNARAVLVHMARRRLRKAASA